MTNLSSVSSDRDSYAINRRELDRYKQIAKDTSLQELMKQASKKRDEY